MVIIGIAALLFSCTTWEPATSEDRSRRFSVPVETAFAALKGAYFDFELDITAGSLESGFLNGQKEAGGAFSQVAIGQAIFWKCNAVLFPDGNTTTIKLKLESVVQDNSARSELGHLTYEEFWALIDQNMPQSK